MLILLSLTNGIWLDVGEETYYHATVVREIEYVIGLRANGSWYIVSSKDNFTELGLPMENVTYHDSTHHNTTAMVRELRDHNGTITNQTVLLRLWDSGGVVRLASEVWVGQSHTFHVGARMRIIEGQLVSDFIVEFVLNSDFVSQATVVKYKTLTFIFKFVKPQVDFIPLIQLIVLIVGISLYCSLGTIRRRTGDWWERRQERLKLEGLRR
jgi:hypothetical protein